MDKQLIIDKMVQARKLTDEALAIASSALTSNDDMQTWRIRYQTGLILDVIDDLLNYLEDNGDD